MLRPGGLDESRCSCRAVSSSCVWKRLSASARERAKPTPCV